MKLLLLLCILAFAMNAQPSTFHGVSIGITESGLTITNSSDNPPLLGLVYQRLDSNGVNTITHEVEYDRILTGKLIQPGGSSAPGPGSYSMRDTFRRRVGRMDSTGKVTMASEGDALGYKILAVVFADGTFYSQATAIDVKAFNSDGSMVPDSVVQDTLFQRLSSDIATIRSIGQAFHGSTKLDTKYGLALMMTPDKVTSGVSRDNRADDRKKQMAAQLLQLADDGARDEALGRLAALPNVTRGNQ